MHLLKALITPFLIVSLVNLDDFKDDWYAQIVNVTDEYVKIDVQKNVIEKLYFEIEGIKTSFYGNTVCIAKKSITRKTTNIVVSSTSEKIYLQLKYNGDFESIMVDDFKYQIGYYLVSLSNNCVILDNDNQYILFYGYNSNIILDNTSFFTNAIFPFFQTNLYINDDLISSTLYLFLEEGTFSYLPYNSTNYAFAYKTFSIDKTHYFKLKSIYSLDVYNNEMYIGMENLIDYIVFPLTIDKTDFYMVLSLEILNVSFKFQFNVTLRHTLLDDASLIEIDKGNREIAYEKTISLF